MVLDEPTNDLDVETLELLEEQLMSYSGTVLLVSHDRAFLDNVVTSSWVFDGKGNLTEYAGGYSDYCRQAGRNARSALNQPAAATPAKSTPASNTPTQTQATPKKPATKAADTRKLTFNERKELGSLPAKLEKLEESITALQLKIADPAFYKKPEKTVNNAKADLEKQEAQLAEAYRRWEELEALA